MSSKNNLTSTGDDVLFSMIKNEKIPKLAEIIVNEKLSLTEIQWNLLLAYPDYECSINLTLLQVADYLIGKHIIEGDEE